MIGDDFVDQLDRAARSPDWRSTLICGDNGPKANLYNVLMALRHCPDLKGTIRLNAFRLEIDVVAPLPWDDRIGREWSRHDDLHLTEWLQHHGIGVKVGDTADGVEAVAAESKYHPVRDWLEGLAWDGQPRVRTWLTYYLGVEDGDYSQAVGARWLISAVARVMRPGCKADHCLVLEGDQGRGKSSALRILVGDDWFTDELADLGSKDAAMQTRGVWVVELAELEHLSRGEVGRIKAFLTRTVDRYRPPYGRRLVMAPRECVFAGTVNDRQYLKDETGNRRFWPVRVGQSIDLAALRHDREQIWAEAVQLWRDGVRWWLEGRSLVELAREEQEGRASVDPWGDKVADHVADKGEVTVASILTEGVGKRLGECTRADEMRIAKIMQQLGWRRGRQSQPPRRWCYLRTADAGPAETHDAP
jgi:predicted P-loop ATPase